MDYQKMYEANIRTSLVSKVLDKLFNVISGALSYSFFTGKWAFALDWSIKACIVGLP